jgi:hypothetical protein
MRYAIEHADGHVQIMGAIPTLLRDGEGRVAFLYVSHNGNKAVFSALDPRHPPLVHIADVPVSEWQPDTIPGFTIAFDNPVEHAAKLPTEYTDDQGRMMFALAPIVGIHPVLDVPADRTFRNAWTVRGSRIDCDMPKAREIWKTKMREARAPKLGALDVEYQRADERGDARSKQEIAARKQVLRDITSDPAIDAAQTTDELKAAWPDMLR